MGATNRTISGKAQAKKKMRTVQTKRTMNAELMLIACVKLEPKKGERNPPLHNNQGALVVLLRIRPRTDEFSSSHSVTQGFFRLEYGWRVACPSL